MQKLELLETVEELRLGLDGENCDKIAGVVGDQVEAIVLVGRFHAERSFVVERNLRHDGPFMIGDFARRSRSHSSTKTGHALAQLKIFDGVIILPVKTHYAISNSALDFAFACMAQRTCRISRALRGRLKES